jgi:hypothetical protein
MRRAIPLAAILISLLPIGCGTKAQNHEDDARALRAAIPSVLAYYQDHNTYDGMTVAELHNYDAAIESLSIVRLSKKTYCVETGSGNPHVFFDTETFALMLGACSDPNNGEPLNSSSEDSSSSGESSDALSLLRASIPAIEAYYQDNYGSYSGMTLSKLRQLDAGLPELRLVDVKKQTYCAEIEADGTSAFTRGPNGEIMLGSCDDPES